MRLVHLRLFASVLTSLVLPTGCGHFSTSSVAAVSSLSVKRSAQLQIHADVVSQQAVAANVKNEFIAALGFQAGTYSADAAHALLYHLGESPERAFLDLSRSVRRASQEVWKTVSASSGELQKLFQNEVGVFLAAVLGDEGYSSFIRELALVENAKPEEREGVIRNLALRLEQLDAIARQRIAAKAGARRWLEGELEKSPFNPAITIRIDVASKNKMPLLISDRSYVLLTRAHKRAFTQRERTCNAELTACRTVFEYSLNQDDMKLLEQVNPDVLRDHEGLTASYVMGERLRTYLDDETLTFSLLVNGRTLKEKTPGRFVRLEVVE
jgi:hypothetical protein